MSFRGVLFLLAPLALILATVPPATPRPVDGDAVAIVNGRSIAKDELVNLLMESHGLAAMQQLIALELARAETQRRGVRVTEADVQAEFDRSLKRIAPETDETGQKLTDENRRQALELVLDQKGISLAEFKIGMERNTHLRKLVEQDFRVLEDTLREEFARTYGARVQVRHIQVPGPRELQEALSQLEAGTEFAEVARRLSANTETAPRGGELAPFSFDDPAIPPVLREAAFSLRPGEVSHPIRVERWYHILKLEQRIAPAAVRFEDMREQVEAALRERVIPQEMNRLVTELFQQAKIRVLDESLRKKYEDLLRRNAASAVETQP